MNIFPFINPILSATEEQNSELSLFQEYAYDFENNQLRTNVKGETYLVSGNDALRIWIYKALATERFGYVAYSSELGNESLSLIGSSLDYDIAISEIRRYIVEALIFNPYVREIKGFVFERNDAGIKVLFDVVTIYGDMSLDYTQRGADG